MFIEFQIIEDFDDILYSFISSDRDDKAIEYLSTQYADVQYCVRIGFDNNVITMRKFFTGYTNAYKSKKQTKSELVVPIKIQTFLLGDFDSIYDVDLVFSYDLSKNSYIEMSAYNHVLKKRKYLSSEENLYLPIRLELGYNYVVGNVLDFLSVDNMKDEINKRNKESYEKLNGRY